MLARVGLVALLPFAACATTTQPATGPTVAPHPAARSPSAASATRAHVDWVVGDLAGLTTVEALRTHLEAGLEQKELHFVGFGEVTVAQCVDRVIAAVQDARQRPGDSLAHAKLSDAVADWLDAMREATVRRSAGRASCLPYLR